MAVSQPNVCSLGSRRPKLKAYSLKASERCLAEDMLARARHRPDVRKRSMWLKSCWGLRRDGASASAARMLSRSAAENPMETLDISAFRPPFSSAVKGNEGKRVRRDCKCCWRKAGVCIP